MNSAKKLLKRKDKNLESHQVQQGNEHHHRHQQQWTMVHIVRVWGMHTILGIRCANQENAVYKWCPEMSLYFLVCHLSVVCHLTHMWVIYAPCLTHFAFSPSRHQYTLEIAYCAKIFHKTLGITRGLYDEAVTNNTDMLKYWRTQCSSLFIFPGTDLIIFISPTWSWSYISFATLIKHFRCGNRIYYQLHFCSSLNYHKFCYGNILNQLLQDHFKCRN